MKDYKYKSVTKWRNIIRIGEYEIDIMIVNAMRGDWMR